MTTQAAMLLFAILVAGILTMWVPERWPLSGFQVAILGLAAYRVVRGGLAIHPVCAAVACVSLWGGVQVMAGWSVDAFGTREAMLDWVVRAAALGLAIDLSGRERDRFLHGCVWFGTLLSVLAMLTAFSSPPGVIGWWRDVGSGVPTLGPFVYRNQYAAFVEVILPLALVRAYAGGERAWMYAAASGLLFASVIASGSRAGAVLCLVELLLISVLSRRGGWKVAAGVAGMTGLLTLAAGWENLWARFQEPHPYQLRWDLLQSSWEMFVSRPWTGWGLGTWAEVYPGFARYDDGTFVNQAHNDWAQWAVEGGLPLLGVMLFVLARLAIPAWRSRWGIGLLAVLIHCWVDYPMQQRPALAVFFFAAIGLILQAGVLRPPLESESIRP